VSGFGGLQIGLSALLAQRQALDIVGQNVANANTEGYSRQRVNMVGRAGQLVPAIHSRWTGGGAGVDVAGFQRIRDEFLEMRGYQEHAVDGNLRQIESTLTRIELAFAEPSDTGLGAQMADFWAGWDDVAAQPGDEAARWQLIQRAQTLVAGFSQLDGALANLHQANIEESKASIDQVNALAHQVGELNSRIQAGVAGGAAPNELMDQRDLLVSQLAEMVGATARPGEAGAVDVFVGGTALVRGVRVEELEVTVGATVSVVWAKDDSPAAVNGSVGGLLSVTNDVLPRYRANLADVADKVRTDVNALHDATATDLDGQPGEPFFVVAPDGSLAVNPVIASDPRKVAASGTGAILDGSRAAALAELTGADKLYRSMIVGLGIESQTAARRVDIQQVIVEQIDTARLAASGVNVDEEMTNLLAFQHAYDAAARFVTAIDEALNTLINSTGHVGR
jgi:flagellar hook-associated protein 1 FlgK